MKINIKEKEIELRYSYRALMMYENIQKKSFNPQTLSDIIIFFYCIALASLRNEELLFDDFMDWIDDNPTSITDFSNWLADIFNLQAVITPDTKIEKKEEKDEKN